jgi:hypothetical protein
MTLTANYAHPLRTIGQDLEALRVESFEMEREGDDYLIRSKVEVPPPEEPLPETNKEKNLRSVLRKMLGRSFEPKEPPPLPPAPVDIELRYTPEDIERLEHEGQHRRRIPTVCRKFCAQSEPMSVAKGLGCVASPCKTNH